MCQESAVLIVSLDLELAWGFNYELLLGARNAFRYLRIIALRSRYNIRKLVSFLEKFKIPITWGIVGHLFLESCEAVNGVPHPEMPRPKLSGSDKDWYHFDPCSNVRKAPLWYAPDLIGMILSSKVEHEIACHSFSHPPFSICSKEVARAEIEACREIMKLYDLDPETFIFPKNDIAHLSILKQLGFSIFRFRQHSSVNLPRCLTDYVLCTRTKHSNTAPLISVHGLTGIPVHFLFQTPYHVNTLKLLSKALLMLKRAIINGTLFHITFHDYIENDLTLWALLFFLRYAAKLRAQGKLHIVTMNRYVEEYV